MRDNKNNKHRAHLWVILIKTTLFPLLTAIVFAFLFIISGCGGPEHIQNPYPGYCTEFTEFPMSGSSYGSASFTDDGKLLAFIFYGDLNSNIPGADTTGIFIYNLEDSSFHGVFTVLPVILECDISPDGEWIVFSWMDQIWKIKTNGDSLTCLIDSGTSFFPHWSPDGKKIVFDTNKDAPHGENVIWMMNADGSGLKRLNEWGKGERREPDFNHKGDRIIHVRSDVEYGSTIATMDTNGGNVKILIKASDIGAYLLSSPHYSPDDSKIVFTARMENPIGIMTWVANADGSNPVPLAVSHDEADWTPDGKSIIYQSGRENGIWIMDANGCNKRPLIGHFNFFEAIGEN